MSIQQSTSRIRLICETWAKKLPLAPGGWAESVRPGWKEGPETKRTMLSQARLAYTFTHAGLPDCGAVERMMKLFWVPELRGWIRSCDKAGNPADMTVDTYDQAFGLLALAWDFRVTGNSESKTAAREALRGLDEDCADPRFGGYREWRNGDSASPMVIYPNFRRQNPHMHLFEAFLAWHTSDPSGPWLERAGDMVSLLRSRFRRPGNGTLAEYFGEAWDLAPGEAGVIREPGHHYEWVWLLKRYEEITGDSSVRKDAEELYRFAREHGTDADGLAFGAVDDKGRIVDDRKPLWPQTETLKAHLAMYEWTGAPAAGEAADRSLSAIKTRYMREDGALFYNLIDRDGKPDPAPSLSRLLYHLFVAAAEAERVLG